MPMRFKDISYALIGIIAVLVIASGAFADIAERFSQAESYEQSGDGVQAETIYQSIATSSVGTEDGLKAQKNLVLLYITSQQSAKAQEALTKLNQEYSGKDMLAPALHTIAVWQEVTGDLKGAKSIYQQIIQQFPASTKANIAVLDSQRVGIISSLRAGDYAQAKTAIDEFQTSFAGQSVYVSSLYDMAQQYEGSGDFDYCKGLYQHIIQQYSTSPQATMAQLDLARLDILALIKSGDLSAAQTALEQFKADFSGQIGFVSALVSMAVDCEAGGGGFHGARIV